ncbi:hypothetical protein DYBT9275_00886 [Dyadobacter sp. CECT 9275]|uniref:Secretion system C-terminal sorting domain-containing protein n=2 Tax=Dyadobacter helix TaxID=2822344 RepID=A0A916J7Y2_9BACT|nr:hypothetical protein DYBT9275_00886 [Dyadobacter sp. CECT 9275]
MFLITLAGHWALAQTANNGSRLNITRKKSAPVGNMKFSRIPENLNYKPLSLHNHKAVNSFYRSYLFSSNTSNDTNGTLVAETSERNVEKRTPVVTAGKAEEQLFANEKISVSNIYPNPASDYAELDYNMLPAVRDAKVIFYSILGSQMNEYNLMRGEKKLRVDTREMPTGLYFYQLVLEGKKVATKKMLVRHQQ